MKKKLNIAIINAIGEWEDYKKLINSKIVSFGFFVKKTFSSRIVSLSLAIKQTNLCPPLSMAP